MPVGKKSISQFERNPAEPSKGAAIAQKQQRPEAAFMGKQLGFPLMRLVKAEQALDFSPQTFTWFLSSNFNSSLFQFSNNMSLLSADECRTTGGGLLKTLRRVQPLNEEVVKCLGV